MFAGIVEKLGRIERVTPSPRGQAQTLAIAADDLFADLPLGASVAVNGACLTLAQRDGRLGHFDVIPETWARTTLADLGAGSVVNLERSLRVGDRIDGHFVQGHIDAVATASELDRTGGQWKLWLSKPEAVAPYLVAKGSVALDGVSLTIVDVAADRFSVALIPTTLETTTLGRRQPGDRINVESDILARMIVTRLQAVVGDQQAAGSGGLTWDHLRGAGFVS